MSSVAFALPFPGYGLLEYSAFGLLALILVVAWGNVVPRRVVAWYAVFSVATSLAASALYVAIYALPLQVRPWGTTTIAWTALNLVWLVVMELRVRDFVLCVAALVMAVLLGVAIADAAGVSGRVAADVELLVVAAPLALLWVRGWVQRTVSWYLAWRLFQWAPDAAQPGARDFFERMLAHAQRHRDQREAALAKLEIARCRYVADERAAAIPELASAIEELGSLDPVWLCIAQRQLGEWLVIVYGTEHDDEALELADASISMAQGFARAYIVLPRTLLLRATCRYVRGDVAGAHSDAVKAQRILGRHKDSTVAPLVTGLLSDLARNAPAEGATAP